MAIPQHIDALTVGSSAFIHGDTIQLTANEQHRRQFVLRKMWAMAMVGEMKRRSIPWDKIRELTGKSRAAWNNVCFSGYVPRDVIEMEDKEVRKEIETARKYRPVSNKFIQDVAASIEEQGYSIHSLGFRNAFDVGMRVVVTNKQLFEHQDVQRGLLLHLDADPILEFIDDNLKPTKDVITLVNGIKDGWNTMGRPFPLLCKDGIQVGDYDALFYLCDVERLVYGVDEETGRPNDKAVNALEEYEVSRYFKDNPENPDDKPFTEHDLPSAHANIPPDGGRFTPPKQLLLKDAIAQVDAMVNSTIKGDDGKPATADMGGFFVQLPKTEVLPQMINNQGQAAFHVIVQFNDKNEPIGTVVMHNPKGGFSVNGL